MFYNMFYNMVYIIIEIVNCIIKSLVNMLCIGLLAFTVVNTVYQPRFDLLNRRLRTLENKQELLYLAVGKLRNIINIDNTINNDLNNKQIKKLEEIKKEIQSINKILNITENDDKCEFEASKCLVPKR